MPQNLMVDLTVTLAAGASVTLPHGLTQPNNSATPPFEVRPDRATPIVCTGVTNTTVSFNNPDAAPQTAIFRVWRYHSVNVPDNTAALLWQGASSGGGGGGGFVYQIAWDPNGILSGNQVTTWAELEALAATVDGPILVSLEDSGVSNTYEITGVGVSLARYSFVIGPTQVNGTLFHAVGSNSVDLPRLIYGAFTYTANAAISVDNDIVDYHFEIANYAEFNPEGVTVTATNAGIVRLNIQHNRNALIYLIGGEGAPPCFDCNPDATSSVFLRLTSDSYAGYISPGGATSIIRNNGLGAVNCTFYLNVLTNPVLIPTTDNAGGGTLPVAYNYAPGVQTVGAGAFAGDPAQKANQVHQIDNTTGGVLTITLPPAADNLGQTYTFQKIDNTADTVRVQGDGTDTINGLPSEDLLAQWDTITVWCNPLNPNWFIISRA